MRKQAEEFIKSGGMTRAEIEERNTLAAWVRYMARNPIYFQFVFKMPMNEANLINAAVQIFGNGHRYYEPVLRVNKYRHKPKRAPMLYGVKEIAAYLGKSVTQVYYYSKHDNLPAWHENGKMVAYVGKLKFWMRTRRMVLGKLEKWVRSSEGKKVLAKAYKVAKKSSAEYAKASTINLEVLARPFTR